MKFFAFVLTVASFAASFAAWADEDESWKAALSPSHELRADLREEIVRIPLRDANAPERGFPLTATLYQPVGAGPFPTVILNHGTPQRRADRDAMGRYRLLPQIAEWVRRGYAVLVPMRRGYGASPGQVADNPGRCEDPQLERAGREAARDVLSAVDFVGTRSSLDRTRVVLLGQSAGGFAALAAAGRAPAGVVAVLNFAGGRLGNGRDGQHCAVDAMSGVIASYARTTRAPVLWLYSENDRYFGPAASRAWFDAFENAGGKGRYILNPPNGEDGHLLFYKADAIGIWSPATRDFFHDFGLGFLP